MQWPHEIISAFCDALVIELQNGTPKDEIIAAMLDWAMRRTVWRAGGDPAPRRGGDRAARTRRSARCAATASTAASPGSPSRATDGGRPSRLWYAYVEKNADGRVRGVPR